MPLEIRQASTVGAGLWEQLLAESDDVWLYHTLPWITVTSQIHRLETQFFLALDGERPLGAFPVQVSREFNEAFSLMMGPAGPFAARSLPAPVRSEVLQRLVARVTEWARSGGLARVAGALPTLSAAHLDGRAAITPLIAAGWR